MSDEDQTPSEPGKFDFSAFPEDTLFVDRRTLPERRDAPKVEAPAPGPPRERRARKERRRRVDPTTFEKQYSEEEIEFMNAIQAFKNRSGKTFPSHGDILNVALTLGYRQSVLIRGDEDADLGWDETHADESSSREDEPCVTA